MNEPSTGPIVRIATHHAAGVPPPAAATRRSADSANPMIGRVDASAMMTTTNSGFRVVDRVADVVPGRLPPGVRRDRDDEHHRPQAEDHFDFAEEVQRLGAQTRRRRQAVRARLLVVPVLHPVRETGEARRRKRVENRQDEHARGDGVERLDLHTHGEIGCERLICAAMGNSPGPSESP